MEFGIGEVKKTALVGIAVLASFATSACAPGSKDRVSYRMEYSNTPAERYKYDYGGYIGSMMDANKTGCLESGPYSSDKVVVTYGHESVDGTPIVDVKPVPPLKSLRFEGFTDYSRPMQPADQYTKQILKAAGCVLDSDNTVSL
jgi:hypothetical protein